MTRFACQQCGKRHQQPDDAAGSLIFCECGQANRVPWESAAPAPQERDEGRGRPGPRRRRWSDADEDEDEPSRRRRPRDPAVCLNHPGAVPAHTCPDCGEAFCPRCLVESSPG